MNAPRPRPPHLPGSYLVLELTNRCSLACVHCSVSEAGHAHHTTLGMLDPRLALALFDDLAAVGARFDTLILFWLGEPLLHPHFPAIYQAALRASAQHQIFGQVEVHTNATHLNAARARVALNAGAVRQVWHFSLDAARRDTYRLIKGVDLFERVESQVESFVAEKGRLGAPWPRLVFQFIVSDKNQAEVPQFRRRWESACRRAGLRLGLSTHAYWEVCRAWALRPSYIACGPVHATLHRGDRAEGCIAQVCLEFGASLAVHPVSYTHLTLPTSDLV